MEPVPQAEPSILRQFGSDFLLGASAAVFAKTLFAPYERTKLLRATYTPGFSPIPPQSRISKMLGRWEDMKRLSAEQGVKAFWRGNFANCLRYAPQQGLVLAFNDSLNAGAPDYDAKTHFWPSFGTKLLAGGCAGALGASFMYPLDFSRVRLAHDIKSGTCKYSGVGNCVNTTVRKEGISRVYRGLSNTLAVAFVYRAGQLGCFKQIQDMNPYKKDKGFMGGFSAFCAVTVARTVVMPFNYPFDTVRRRMMLQSEKPVAERLYKGSIHCFTSVLKAEGAAGMYKGLVPELFRGVGGSLVIVAYDRIKLIFEL